MATSALPAEAAASNIRSWALDNDVPVGSRGRLGPIAKTAFFSAHPKVAREVAGAAGITVPARGRISDEAMESIVRVLP